MLSMFKNTWSSCQSKGSTMRTGKGNTSHRLDRELFHAWLWSKRGRKDIIQLTQAEMAEILQCSKYTPNRVIAELIAAGKVKKLRNGKYQVVDPNETPILT